MQTERPKKNLLFSSKINSPPVFIFDQFSHSNRFGKKEIYLTGKKVNFFFKCSRPETIASTQHTTNFEQKKKFKNFLSAHLHLHPVCLAHSHTAHHSTSTSNIFLHVLFSFDIYPFHFHSILFFFNFVSTKLTI